MKKQNLQCLDDWKADLKRKNAISIWVYDNNGKEKLYAKGKLAYH